MVSVVIPCYSEEFTFILKNGTHCLPSLNDFGELDFNCKVKNLIFKHKVR